jgi:hypothetical protein
VVRRIVLTYKSGPHFKKVWETLLYGKQQRKVLKGIFSLWLYSPIQALAPSMKLSISLQLLDLGKSIGLFGRVVSLSQGLYLYTNTGKRAHNTNTKHPCAEWDSNPRSRRPRERRQFMPQTARLPWPAMKSILTCNSVKLMYYSQYQAGYIIH